MFATVLRRLAWATIFTVVLVVVATAGMYLTSAPKYVSLLAEPFSLLLMPGLVLAVVLSGPHDFVPVDVVFIAAGFYLCFFYWALPRIANAVQFQRPGSR